VFGDIGTSPLYTIQTVFSPDDPHPIAVSTDNLFGVVSLIFWSIMTIVTLTYVILVMRADNHGEGGIMALITRIGRKSAKGSSRTKAALVAVGLFGAALFFGDSMITPAISVLSAVEGLEVAAPSLDHLILPITAGIIIALFASQRFGSDKIGRLFGPVMVVWFVVIGGLGIHGITEDPSILKALSPTYAAGFVFNHFEYAFFALGSVILAVTGAEALYADMGHFGRRSITLAWFSLVLPACALCYLGQGAEILSNPSLANNGPFFHLGPDWAQFPIIILATAATVIASQAVITGAYSLTHQAVQLGYLPRLRIRHTSDHTMGQIYVPWINWTLMISVLLLIFTFESSEKLAFAYGVAVTGTIITTTTLYFYFARQQWGWPLWAVIGGGAVLLTIDALFLAANLLKLFHGAWLPLLIGALTFTVLMTWKRGREIVNERRHKYEGPLREFIIEFNTMDPPIQRVPGTAIFLNRDPEAAPLAMRACVEHLKSLHEHVVILTITTATVPHMAVGEQFTVDDLGYADDGINHVTTTFGYMDAPRVPEVMRLLQSSGELECPLEVGEASYFLSEIELRRGHVPGMASWRKALFIATAHIAADAADYFGLPQDQTIILGSKIEI
jgi:KUP system potassium uptake protein